MAVVNFPDGKHEETKITIVWRDGSDPMEAVCTAFGNAEGANDTLVFYNDNLSEIPLLIIPSDNIKFIKLNPLVARKSDDEITH